jgi:hypothetical protein
MNPVSLRNVAGLFLWVFVVACVSLWSMPEPKPFADVLTTNELNAQMQMPQDHVASSYQALKQWRSWGEAFESVDNSADPEARQKITADSLKGIVRQGGHPVALIAVDGHVERYREGQMLPGGIILVTISDGKVTLSDKNRQFDWELYYSEPPQGN